MVEEPMPRGYLAHRLRDQRQEAPIPRDAWQITLQVGQVTQLSWATSQPAAPPSSAATSMPAMPAARCAYRTTPAAIATVL